MSDNKITIYSDSYFTIRNDSNENWALVNPVLLKGELGIEFSETGSKIKIGNGVTPWNDLPYFNEIDNVTEIVNENLNSKANRSEVYTKDEIDGKLGDIVEVLSTVVSGGAE